MASPATKTYHSVTITETGEVFRCAEDETVLVGMKRLGKCGIPVGCCGGGCGVCKVQIDSGDFKPCAMSREHISAEEQEAGIVLACRVRPRSDMALTVLGKMKKRVCAQPGMQTGTASAAGTGFVLPAMQTGDSGASTSRASSL